jgi:hypothetical protein
MHRLGMTAFNAVQVTLGVAGGGDLPRMSSRWIMDWLPIAVFANPQFAGVSMSLACALLFSSLTYHLRVISIPTEIRMA